MFGRPIILMPAILNNELSQVTGKGNKVVYINEKPAACATGFFSLTLFNKS